VRVACCAYPWVLPPYLLSTDRVGYALCDRPQHDMTPDHQHLVALRVCVSLRPPRSTNRPFDRVLQLLLRRRPFSSPRPVHPAWFDLACHPARRAHHPTRLARLSFHSRFTLLVIDRSLTLSRLPAPHSSVLARCHLYSTLPSSAAAPPVRPPSACSCLTLYSFGRCLRINTARNPRQFLRHPNRTTSHSHYEQRYGHLLPGRSGAS
jgi:hypothetical protein